MIWHSKLRFVESFSSSSSSSSSSILLARKGAMSRNNKGFGRNNGNNNSNGMKDDESSSIMQNDSSLQQPIVVTEQLQQIQHADCIYSMPALYDLAFGYRNFQQEVDFLLNIHEKYGTGIASPATSVLELAAGPARHLLEALQRSVEQDAPEESTLMSSLSVETATALDNSPDMVRYGMELATHELGEAITSFTYVEGDMRNFQLPQTFDTAWILLGSLQHMTTNENVLQCFRNVHGVLNEGGTLILELPHPRETFSMVECTRNGWEVPLEDEAGTPYGELQIIWGDDNDTFDPITQVRQFSISMNIQSDEPISRGLKSVSEIVPIRLFTSQEICAMASCCGFEVSAMFGALDEEISVNDEDAFRLVCVLHKASQEIMKT